MAEGAEVKVAVAPQAADAGEAPTTDMPGDVYDFDFWAHCSKTEKTIMAVGKSGFRQSYEATRSAIKSRYVNFSSEFSDDDQNDLLSPEEKRQGFFYPLTKTEQKAEFGCVVADQERFIMHLQDGHLSVVQEYLNDEKKMRAITLEHCDNQGLAPLHYAAKLNHASIARALLEADADPNLRDNKLGWTAMDHAKAGKNNYSGPNKDVIAVLEEFD